MKVFRLVITSVSGALFDGEAVSATMPASSGEMTILADHEPLITTLKAGNIAVKVPEGQSQEFPIENGVVECASNKVTVLL